MAIASNTIHLRHAQSIGQAWGHALVLGVHVERATGEVGHPTVVVPHCAHQGEQYVVLIGVQREHQLQDSEESGIADGYGGRCPLGGLYKAEWTGARTSRKS